MCTTLEDLPEELKQHIIWFLDVIPKSIEFINGDPYDLLWIDESIDTPLKSLSLVSKAWRQRVKPFLFQCMVFDLGFREGETLHFWLEQELERLHDAIRNLSVQADIRSLLVLTEEYIYRSDAFPNDDFEHSAPWAKYGFIATLGQSFWYTLTSMLNPLHLTILMPTETLENVLRISTSQYPYGPHPETRVSLLRLSQNPATWPQRIYRPRNCGWQAKAALCHRYMDWESCLLHEGTQSSRDRRGEWEAPSLIYGIVDSLEPYPFKRFTYRAVFPVRFTLDSIAMAAEHVECLEISLTPNVEDSNQHAQLHRGSVNVSMGWKGIDVFYGKLTSWDQPGHGHLFGKGSRLREFITRDVSHDSIRDRLEAFFKSPAVIEQGWERVAKGHWRRTVPGQKTILDTNGD